MDSKLDLSLVKIDFFSMDVKLDAFELNNSRPYSCEKCRKKCSTPVHLSHYLKLDVIPVLVYLTIPCESGKDLNRIPLEEILQPPLLI